MARASFLLGCSLLAAAVAAGAFGAHWLRSVLDERALDLWDTACRYLALTGTGLLGVALAGDRWPGSRWRIATCCLVGGGVVFSGTVGALALGGPRWLGAVTPVGGMLIIAGFLVAGLAAVGPRSGRT